MVSRNLILDVPGRAHLDSPVPPPRRLSTAGVKSGNGESSASSSLDARVAPGFPRRTQWTRRPSGGGLGPGAGEARRGAYLVHGERHADSVLLQQHGLAGREPRWKKGSSQLMSKVGAQRRARALGAGEGSSPGGAISSWLSPVRPGACQASGPGVFDSPASFLGEISLPGIAKSGTEGGRLAGGGSDR